MTIGELRRLFITAVRRLADDLAIVDKPAEMEDRVSVVASAFLSHLKNQDTSRIGDRDEVIDNLLGIGDVGLLQRRLTWMASKLHFKDKRDFAKDVLERSEIEISGLVEELLAIQKLDITEPLRIEVVRRRLRSVEQLRTLISELISRL